MSLFNELQRRNVFRVTVAYVISAWLLAQVADLVLDNISAPEWVMQTILLVLLLGLAPVVFFSWAYEVTPEGIKREADVDRSNSITHVTRRKLDRTITFVLVLAVAYFAADKFLLSPAQPVTMPATTEASTTGNSIAVLPFVNMSSDPENEYFADGLSEELLNQLAQIPDLLVAGRTSSFSFKGKNEDLREIGATLGVANILEGSVRRQGDTVRVTAQLIRVSDGFHLWSNTYDRTMDDVFVIQDDISENVASAMKIILDESSRQRMQRAGVRNVEAFVEYQKGREIFSQAHGNDDDGLMDKLSEGVVHFDRAIELVSEFVAAYWEKSDYYAHYILEPDSTNDERASALDELRQIHDVAYRLSVDSPLRPMIDVDRVLFSDDWTSLRDRVEKALVPVKCPEPTWIEVVITAEFEEAALEMWQQYLRCDPLNSTGLQQVADTASRLGRYDMAFDVLNNAEVQLGANQWIAASRQWSFMMQGNVEEALALAPQLIGDSIFYGMGAEAKPLAMSGDIDGANAALEQWKAQYGQNTRAELEVQAAMGNRDRANKLAAEIDARPGGPMVLLLTERNCACGAPFDLEATPNFRDRISEFGMAWPTKTLIKYPAKDW